MLKVSGSKFLFIILLSLCLVLQSVVVFVKASNDEFDEKLVEKLKALEVISTMDKELSSSVTRGEFASLIVKFLNIEDTYSSKVTSTPFVDVSIFDEYAPAISYLYDMGFVKGIGSRKFNQDQNISCNQAISILISVLGYKEVADLQGGFPYGYIKQADKLKLLKGINSLGANEITLYDVYTLFNNSLHIKVASVLTINGRITLTIDNEKDFLSTYYNLYRITGLVTANKYTSLTNPLSFVLENEIEIGQMLFVCNKDYSNYLGMQVEAYSTKLSDDNKEIIYINPLNKNNIVTINFNDFISITNDNVEYWISESDRKKTLEISDNVDVIYNDVSYIGYGKISDIVWTSGALQLLDNDGDEIIDVLKFSQYENLLVDSVDFEFNIIYDDLHKTAISFENGIVEVIRKDGKLMKFRDIKQGQIYSMTRSKNKIGNVLNRLYLCDESVNGTINEIEDNNYLISKNSYKLANDVTISLIVGDTGTFYLNQFDEIVYFKATDTDSYKYALVYGFSELNSLLYDLQISLFTADNECVIFDFAHRVSVTGKIINSKNNNGAKEILSDIVVGEIVQYKVNTSNEIFELNIAKKASDTSYEDEFYKARDLTSFYYRSGNLNGQFYLDKETIIFSKKSGTNWSEENLAALPNSILKVDTSYTTKCSVYVYGDKHEKKVACLLFHDEFDTSITSEDFLGVITNISDVLHDDQPTKKIRTTSDECNVDESLIPIVGTLNIGDIIRISKDYRGVGKGIQVVMNVDGKAGNGASLTPFEQLDSDKVNKTSTSRFDASYYAAYVTIKDIQENYLLYSIDIYNGIDMVPSEYISSITNPNVNIYDTARRMVYPSDKSQLIKGEKAVIHFRYAIANQIIIFR